MDTIAVPFAARLIGRRDLFLFCAAAYNAAARFTAPGARTGKAPSSSWRYADNLRPQEQTGVFQSMRFEAAVTELPFAEGVREHFIVDGHLMMSGKGLVGTVNVTLADTTAVLIRCADNEFVSCYGGAKVRLPMDGDTVRVNGAAVKIRSVIEQLIAENDFSGIGALSDQSKAVIALHALANTDLFLSGMATKDASDGRGLIDKLCRLSPAPSMALGWWRGTSGTRAKPA